MAKRDVVGGGAGAVARGSLNADVWKGAGAGIGGIEGAAAFRKWVEKMSAGGER